MSLFEKLVGTSDPDDGISKLPIHQFVAALQLWQMEVISRLQLVNAFNLEPSDNAGLDFIKNKYIATILGDAEFAVTIESLLVLGEEQLLGLEIEANFIVAVNGLP